MKYYLRAYRHVGDSVQKESEVFAESVEVLAEQRMDAIREAVRIDMMYRAALGSLAAAQEREADPSYDPIQYYEGRTDGNG